MLNIHYLHEKNFYKMMCFYNLRITYTQLWKTGNQNLIRKKVVLIIPKNLNNAH